jgi:hypothetical protein
MRAPIAANLDSILLAFIRFDLWFQSETRRTKDEVQLRRRLDSEDSVWPIALAKEQWAAITKRGFHGIPFRVGLWVMVGRFTGATGCGSLRDCCRPENAQA